MVNHDDSVGTAPDPFVWSGVGGVSYAEMLILFELWVGERLVLEKALLRYCKPGRRISVSAVPLGPDIEIWRSCRFIWGSYEIT